MLTPSLDAVRERIEAKFAPGPFEQALLQELRILDRDPVISARIQSISTTLPPGPVPPSTVCGCCGQTI